MHEGMVGRWLTLEAIISGQLKLKGAQYET